MDLKKPLSEDDLNELEEFLLSDTTPDTCMDIVTLDGFLTAIVSGPEAIMPSEWMPMVWGEVEAEFETLEQAQRIMGFIIRHMNGIVTVLMEEPERFEPMLYEKDIEGNTYAIADGWCLGYLKGLVLRKEQWKPLLKDENLAELILPMITLISQDDDPEFGELVDTPEKRKIFVDMLPGSAQTIHRFWLDRRSSNPSRPPKDSKSMDRKVGRNKPCPCGSGKKFKKCCGAQERLN